MMKKNILLIILSTFIIASCSDTSTLDDASFRVVKTDAEFGYKGGEGTIEVSEENVTAKAEDDWLKTNVSGTIIHITAEPNISYESRTTTVLLKKGNTIQKVPITQFGTIDDTNIYSHVFPTGGGKKSFLLKTVHLPPTVELPEEAKEWLTWEVVGDSIVFTAQPYTGISQRTAPVSVSPQNGAVTEVVFSQYTSYEGTYRLSYINMKQEARNGFCIIEKNSEGGYTLKMIPQERADFGLSSISFQVVEMPDGSVVLNETQVLFSNKDLYLRIIGLVYLELLAPFSPDLYFTLKPTFDPSGLSITFVPHGQIREKNMDAILLAVGTATKIYDGQTGTLMNIVLRKISNDTNSPEIPQNPPTTGNGFNLMELFAEYNVSVQPGVFAKDHQVENQGFYNFSEIENICPEGYRLPTENDFNILVGTDIKHLVFTGTSDFSDVSETVRVGNKTYKFTADYFTDTKDICYGIKFKGGNNQFRAAYYWENNKTDNTFIVKTRLIGDDSSIDIKKVASSDFWNNNNGQDIIRIFPAAGYKAKNGSHLGKGSMTYLWSSDIDVSGSKAIIMYFLRGNYGMTGNIGVSQYNNVRCIRR
ncbi:BACON domain-containing protein [Bacteroides heparinolyticus]|uniref:BACON domain-containing protein n=1 Tax=Prevotella heparinolytica TaxID=28113 RepID=UPI0035A0E406